jgi:hypothetical protein
MYARTLHTLAHQPNISILGLLFCIAMQLVVSPLATYIAVFVWTCVVLLLLLTTVVLPTPPETPPAPTPTITADHKQRARHRLVHAYGRVFLLRHPTRAPVSFTRVYIDGPFHNLEPSSLAQIFEFHTALETMLLHHLRLAIVVGVDPTHVTSVALLLGSHMIIAHGMSPDEVSRRLRSLSPMFEAFVRSHTALSIEDCWRAIHRANALGWTHFDHTPPASGTIDMHEYLHYDDTLNGAIHLLDPARILLFRPPSHLPRGVMWRDVAGRRYFGPEHYTALFEDFGVRLVICCGAPASCCDTRAWRAAGLVVELLHLPGVLPSIDRFLTLLKVVPGCIAVQCGSADATVRLAVAAHLIRHRGFSAPAAIAWTHIVHPVMPDPVSKEVVLMVGSK